MSQQNNDAAKKAIALKYDQETNGAPQIVAKGRGFIAEQIMSAAKQHSIPVYQNKVLTDMLMLVELDREIPPELYKAVAEVLAYVYRVDKTLSKKRK